MGKSTNPKKKASPAVLHLPGRPDLLRRLVNVLKRRAKAIAPKHPRGRPEFVFTPEIIAKIEVLAMIGRSLKSIATIIGCAESVLERAHRADKMDPPKYGGKIKDALLKGRETADANIDLAIYDMITKDHNPTMAIFYLKCRKGWKEPKSQLEVSAPGGQPLVPQNIPAKDRAALQAWAKSTARNRALGGDAGPAPVDAPKNKKGR